MVIWEWLAPRKTRPVHRRARWPGNIGVVLIDTLLVRIVVPTGVVGFAMWVKVRGWGLFNQTGFPRWIEVALAVALLDLVIYLQHRAFHYVPILWRLHRMHHADLDID